MTRLIVLTHGVGSEPVSMLGVAHWWAAREPSAFIVSIASAHASDISDGFQWFSVVGVTQENRQARVDTAMPAFVASIVHWQRIAGMDAAHTVIVGFSQGAIMALESTKLPTPPAAEVFSLAGRFATLPAQRPAAAIHLLHGTADAVMPVQLTEAAHLQLTQLGAHSTVTIVPGVAHQPHPELLARWSNA